MRKLLPTLLSAALLLVAPAVFAADCVDVDIELPATLAPLEMSNGYFELTNCGDEATTVWLEVDVDFSGQTFSLGNIPVMLAAGETRSREFVFIVPPPAAGATVELCVTATAGDASASDCAVVSVTDGTGTESSGGDDRFVFSLASTSAADCAELDLELSDTVYTTPGDFFMEGFFELVNCGDEADTALLTVEVFFLGEEISVTDIPVPLEAGGVISREFMFPAPPPAAGTEFTLCVTATIGESTESICETVVILAGDDGTDSGAPADLGAVNHPNPFNPSTTISFQLPAASQVSVSVYNMLGQEVARLVDNQAYGAGPHEIIWDGRTEGGEAAASGVYFYKITAGSDVVTKKMLLTK